LTKVARIFCFEVITLRSDGATAIRSAAAINHDGIHQGQRSGRDGLEAGIGVADNRQLTVTPSHHLRRWLPIAAGGRVAAQVTKVKVALPNSHSPPCNPEAVLPLRVLAVRLSVPSLLVPPPAICNIVFQPGVVERHLSAGAGENAAAALGAIPGQDDTGKLAAP
jgi:hypothetical protein